MVIICHARRRRHSIHFTLWNSYCSWYWSLLSFCIYTWFYLHTDKKQYCQWWINLHVVVPLVHPTSIRALLSVRHNINFRMFLSIHRTYWTSSFKLSKHFHFTHKISLWPTVHYPGDDLRMEYSLKRRQVESALLLLGHQNNTTYKRPW